MLTLSLTLLVSLGAASPLPRLGLRALARRLRRRKADGQPPLVVVKLGGSAVTRKGEFETLNAECLAATAAALARARASGTRTVLIHGAGSFGHFQAHEHGVSKGAADSRFSWLGFAETRSSVTRLNALVVAAMLREGVPTVGLPPFPRWKTNAGSLVPSIAALDELRAALDAGLVPCTHGDAVLDEARGCSILSGDQIIGALCDELAPTLAVFLTDVAGVFDRPPSEPDAKLLPEVRVGKGGEAVCAVGTSVAAHDVTGGIAAKLEAARAIAASGVPVCIVEAGTRHAEAALRGERPEVCTWISRG